MLRISNVDWVDYCAYCLRANDIIYIASVPTSICGYDYESQYIIPSEVIPVESYLQFDYYIAGSISHSIRIRSDVANDGM